MDDQVMPTVVSAFGVVHTIAKAEFAPGEYGTYVPSGKTRPVRSQGEKEGRTVRTLRPAERSVLRVYTKQKKLNPRKPPAPGGRGSQAVYGGHGIAQTRNKQGVNGPREEEQMHRMFHGATDQSTVHPNVQFAPTVSHDLRRHIDQNLDKDLIARSPHPIVFHHDPRMAENVEAAGAGANVVSGHKGHVVLGASYKVSGAYVGVHEESGHVLNHEVVHASKKLKNPTSLPSRGGVGNLGEEGRADTISGTHLYRKLGLVPKNRLVAQMEREQRAVGLKQSPEFTAGAAAIRRYNKVTHNIEVARRGIIR